MKKGMKRFLGIVLAMVMMLSMSISVFAADNDISVTVTLNAVADGTHPALNGSATVKVAPGTNVELIVKEALPGNDAQWLCCFVRPPYSRDVLPGFSPDSFKQGYCPDHRRYI